MGSFYPKHLYSEKYAKYRKYALGGKGGRFMQEALPARAAAGQALTCPSWCIRTPPCCPPPHAGDAKLRPTCPANAVIILLENTCPSYGQARKSIMTSLPSENETYLVSPARGGDVERSETERARKACGGAQRDREPPGAYFRYFAYFFKYRYFR